MEVQTFDAAGMFLVYRLEPSVSHGGQNGPVAKNAKNSLNPASVGDISLNCLLKSDFTGKYRIDSVVDQCPAGMQRGTMRSGRHRVRYMTAIQEISLLALDWWAKCGGPYCHDGWLGTLNRF
jgi:hypothetical protein